MNLKRIIIGIIFIIASQSTFSQGQTISYFYDPYTKPVELIIDIVHLNAEIQIEPTKNKIIAKTEFKFVTKRINTDSISFYAPNFKFSSIEIIGVPSRFIQQGVNVVIFPNSNMEIGKEYSIVMNYEVSPEDGNPYFVGWDDPKNKLRKQIWGHRPHGWLPFIDDRMTVDMFITFESDYSVFSNGERIAVTNNDNNTKTWHYRMNKNHPFFSTALVIGKYQYKALRSKSGVPLELWFYPEYADRFETTYQYSAEMIDYFEKEMDFTYPWELYRQAPVANYLFGAMETTTATIFGDYMQIDEGGYWQRNYINVNAHELAHQWFGNYISHLTPKDVWLTESFATYYAKMFEKSIFGEDYYQNDKLQEIDKTFQEAAKNSNPIASGSAGSFRIYQKGSLVLDMLRYVLGDEYFKLSVKYYLEANQYDYAETHDFLRAIYKTTGMNLDWFFEQWLYRGGEPHYDVQYEVNDDGNGRRFTLITVKQIHTRGELVKTFRMPIDFAVYYRDGTHDSLRAWVDGEVTCITVPNQNRKNIDFVLFDPGNKILKKVTFSKDYHELSAQALNAPNMIDRYDALLGLRQFELSKKMEILYKCYQQEDFHLTKGEIIKQLADGYISGDLATSNGFEFDDETPLRIFKSAIRDEDALVRRAIVDHVTKIHTSLKKDYMLLLSDESYANVQLALSNLAVEFPSDIGLYLSKTDEMEGWRGKNIRMKWLELAIQNGDNEYMTELLDYATVSYEFETRMNAIELLKKLNYLDIDYLNSLFEAANHWNFKLRNVAVDAVKYYNQQIEYQKMMMNSLEFGNYPAKWKKNLENLLH